MIDKYSSWLFVLLLGVASGIQAQCYWQQEVRYQMDIRMDVDKNQLRGVQKLHYTNHSPDTLRQVFYHLYFNAFQPGSMMDIRSRTIVDPDRRVKDRISHLESSERGWQDIQRVSQEGRTLAHQVRGTLLQVTLDVPLLPGQTTELDVLFEAQVPLQIRRCGRDNAEGIRFTMTQWYPKLCAYDESGWHPNPYVGREFYGEWGDFEVVIRIDSTYVLGASGTLQNAGASPELKPREFTAEGLRVWRYKAHRVHDFAWGADPDYRHVVYRRKEGTQLHFLYQPGEKTKEWQKLPAVMDQVFEYANAHYGQYPYPEYSFVQGGDGGMEYPMLTMITGHRSFRSLVGVCVHELMHSWYQGVLATNESLYPWMDEGFTSFASTEIMNYLAREGLLGEANKPQDNPFADEVEGYLNYVKSGHNEALCTHADHFSTNYAYGMGSYVKGQLFLYQLGYIVGDETLHRGLKRYFNTWKFKHPKDLDFVRVMERTSGMQLDWYYRYWVHTTHHIDYAIDTVVAVDKLFEKKTRITLSNAGKMPMPIDVVVTLKNGNQKGFNIPLRMMFGYKREAYGNIPTQIMEAWPWVNPTYELILPISLGRIDRIEIDPSQRLIDIDRSNNSWTAHPK